MYVCAHRILLACPLPSEYTHKVEEVTTLTPESYPCMITPTTANLHELKAVRLVAYTWGTLPSAATENSSYCIASQFISSFSWMPELSIPPSFPTNHLALLIYSTTTLYSEPVGFLDVLVPSYAPEQVSFLKMNLTCINLSIV